MSRVRRGLRALADLAVAAAVTLAPVLFPRALDDPPAGRRCRRRRVTRRPRW